jgi:hypothetical protein
MHDFNSFAIMVYYIFTVKKLETYVAQLYFWTFAQCVVSALAGTIRIFMASRAAVLPTHLETQTKEFNMCASHWVFKTQRCS